MGVNNLPGVATQQCTGRESNLRPLDHKSNALPLYLKHGCSFIMKAFYVIGTVDRLSHVIGLSLLPVKIWIMFVL